MKNYFIVIIINHYVIISIRIQILYFCYMTKINNSISNLNILNSLDSIIEELISKIAKSTNELDAMNFDELLKSIQSLTRTVQNFIKIIELTKGKNEIFEEESKFVDKIINDKELLEIAEKLLEKLSDP